MGVSGVGVTTLSTSFIGPVSASTGTNSKITMPVPHHQRTSSLTSREVDADFSFLVRPDRHGTFLTHLGYSSVAVLTVKSISITRPWIYPGRCWVP